MRCTEKRKRLQATAERQPNGWVLCPLKRTRSQYRMDVNGRDVNGAAHGAHCTFEITLLQAITLTLLLVCAFSPKVQKYLLGSLITALLRYIAKRHKESAKINTLHNARKRKRFPNANLWLGSCPLERTRLIAERASLLAKWSVSAQRFRAVARANLFAQRTLTDKKITQSFDCVILVDVNGLEPLTFSTSRRHSTS